MPWLVYHCKLLSCHERYRTEEPNRLKVFFKNKCHVISNQKCRPPLFLLKLFKHYWKWQWGATGKATRLFSHKLRLDQKWINFCKKVYHPKHVLSKSFTPIWRGAPFHFSIDICFALIIIFVNFKVLEVQNTKKTFLGVSWWYVINCSKIRQWTYTSKILVAIPPPLICITLKIPISNDLLSSVDCKRNFKDRNWIFFGV